MVIQHLFAENYSCYQRGNKNLIPWNTYNKEVLKVNNLLTKLLIHVQVDTSHSWQCGNLIVNENKNISSLIILSDSMLMLNDLWLLNETAEWTNKFHVID